MIIGKNPGIIPNLGYNSSMSSNCPICHQEISPNDVFCSHCGAKIPGRDTALSNKQKVKIYIVSVILAPLGIYWFFKYFRSEDPQKKKIAYHVLWITILITISMVILTYYISNSYSNYMDTFMLENGLFL